MTQTKTKRPAMTAEEAKRFTTYSMPNVMVLAACLRCDCSPYEDVFTYNRWKAQGYQVRRGEKAISLPLMKDIIEEDKDGDILGSHRIFAHSNVFCRCQVDEINNR